MDRFFPNPLPLLYTFRVQTFSLHFYFCFCYFALASVESLIGFISLRFVELREFPYLLLFHRSPFSPLPISLASVDPPFSDSGCAF